MAYVPVPKDLSQVKSKVIFNLTKRQLLCFGSGALVSVPLFFLLKKPLGTTTAAMAMMIVMLPFFLFDLRCILIFHTATSLIFTDRIT